MLLYCNRILRNTYESINLKFKKINEISACYFG